MSWVMLVFFCVVDPLSYLEFLVPIYKRSISLKELDIFTHGFMTHVYIGCKSFSELQGYLALLFLSCLFLLLLYILFCVSKIPEICAFGSANVPSTFPILMLNTMVHKL